MSNSASRYKNLQLELSSASPELAIKLGSFQMIEKKVSLGSLAGISEVEMSKRIKEGQQRAKVQGRHIGRKKTRNSELIRALLKSNMSYRKIAKITGTSRGSINNEKKLMLSENENIDSLF